MIDDHGDELRGRMRAVLPSEALVVPDVAISLDLLCQAAMAELELDHVSVTVLAPSGSYAVVAAAPSSGAGIESLQFDFGEGPGPEVSSSGRPVLVPDLRETLGRWPGFASVAVEHDVRAAFVFPLQLGEIRFGVLTCLNATPRTLTRDELTACVIFAEVATELMLDSSPTGDHPDPDLGSSLRVGAEVFQAQGMTMVDLGVSLEVALARMRAAAFAEGITLQALAADIVAGRRSLDRAREGDP